MVKRSLKGILILLAIYLSINNINSYATSAAVVVDFINVGQGDAALITSAGGRTMLIDSGKADSKTPADTSIVRGEVSAIPQGGNDSLCPIRCGVLPRPLPCPEIGPISD